MHADGLFILEALVKVFPFQHLRHRELRGEADHAFEPEPVEPF